MSQVLLDRLLHAFPEKFVKRLLSRQLAIYKQSVELALNEQPWSIIEGIAVLPHLRRSLWENELRNAAVECGLAFFDRQHLGLNSSCVNVKSGNVVLTEHFVSGPNEFVRDAESRKQNAGVNRFLNHHVDSRLLTHPIPKLSEKPIYLNLLHGSAFPTTRDPQAEIDSTTCFLRFAIPAADDRKYLDGCNWSAQELIQHYANMPQNMIEPAVNVADRVRPLVKKMA